MESDPAARLLREAVNQGRPGKVQTLLASMDPQTAKSAVDHKDSDGFTLLHRACASEQVEIMRMLLEAKANPNAQDSCGDTPLHWACFSGNLEAVGALLDAPFEKANPLFNSNDGKTPLDAALEERHTHILQRLFDVPQVFEKRAVLESVLLRGPLALKEARTLVPDRINRYRTWKTHQVVLSSMVRAMFVCKGRAMAEKWQDVEHFDFQDILAVRWVTETRQQYLGRRINVYVQLRFGDKLRIVQVGGGGGGGDDGGEKLLGTDGKPRETGGVGHRQREGRRCADQRKGRGPRAGARGSRLGRWGRGQVRAPARTARRARQGWWIVPPPQQLRAERGGGHGLARGEEVPPARHAPAAAARRDAGHLHRVPGRHKAGGQPLVREPDHGRGFGQNAARGAHPERLAQARGHGQARAAQEGPGARLQARRAEGHWWVLLPGPPQPRALTRRAPVEDVRFVPLDVSHTKPPPVQRPKDPNRPSATQQITKYIAHTKVGRSLRAAASVASAR
jgi:hypothetical protein